MSTLKVEFTLGKNGAIAAKEQNKVVIVIDVLRATSSIVTLVDMGVRAIIPTDNLNIQADLFIGELNGKRLPECQLNNSPHEIKKQKIPPDTLVAIKTTNGSNCIIHGKGDDNHVLIGAALNATACALTAYYIAKQDSREIAIVMAGHRGAVAIEDLLIGTLIYDSLPGKKSLSGAFKPYRVDDLLCSVMNTDSARNLVQLGYEKDIFYCCKQDITRTVPYYNGGIIQAFEPGIFV